MIQLFKCFKINDVIFMPFRFKYDTDTGLISRVNCISIDKDDINCDAIIVYNELDPNIINIDTNIFFDTFKDALKQKNYTKGQPIRNISNSSEHTIYIPHGNISVFIDEDKRIIATIDNIEIFKGNQFLYIPIGRRLTIGDIVLIKKGALVSDSSNKMIAKIYSIQISRFGKIIKINEIDIDMFDSVEQIGNEPIIEAYFNPHL